jgi:phage tail sheath protein FI
MAPYTTPGVYVEEIATLAPSLVEVSTAIPAFVGFTENAVTKPVRVSTLLDYRELFGGPQLARFVVTTKKNDGVTSIDRVELPEPPTCLLYYAMAHFFANGGGSSYVSSAGAYDGARIDPAGKQAAALARLEQEDEPTLLVLTDAPSLPPAKCWELYDQALRQCGKLKDRFSILDVPGGPDDLSVKAFRSGVNGHLSYGAAYTPYLQTSLSYAYTDEGVNVQFGPSAVFENAIEVSCSVPPPRVAIVAGDRTAFSLDRNVLTITVAKGETGAAVIAAWDALDPNPAKLAGFKLAASAGAVISPGEYTVDARGAVVDEQAFTATYQDPTRTVSVAVSGTDITFVATPTTLTITVPAVNTGKQVVAAWGAWKKEKDTHGFDIIQSGTGAAALVTGTKNLTINTRILAELRSTDTALYYQIKARLASEWVVLPPSAAVAGVYASVDRDRGVWKAPANLALAAVVGPVVKITDDQQGGLNVDPSGKSINAIRAFTGKGTLVWGARTLNGNSNEWKYVPVRRLFIMVEESARKATAFAVFEPNVLATWLKVKGMIESFLYSLWERGALAGSTPEQAYFVSVGLGKTMTPQNILDGEMIVVVGIAAVRPAEFIILRFTHKLQEA